MHYRADVRIDWKKRQELYSLQVPKTNNKEFSSIQKALVFYKRMWAMHPCI